MSEKKESFLRFLKRRPIRRSAAKMYVRFLQSRKDRLVERMRGNMTNMNVARLELLEAKIRYYDKCFNAWGRYRPEFSFSSEQLFDMKSERDKLGFNSIRTGIRAAILTRGELIDCSENISSVSTDRFRPSIMSKEEVRSADIILFMDDNKRSKIIRNKFGLTHTVNNSYVIGKHGVISPPPDSVLDRIVEAVRSKYPSNRLIISSPPYKRSLSIDVIDESGDTEGGVISSILLSDSSDGETFTKEGIWKS
jgi:hypothetical protein